MNTERFMQMAIDAARNSQTPFGAVIVRDGEVVARAGNTVQPDNDPSAHAEVNVIRKLTQQIGRPSLDGHYTLYSTCEPCPMCAAICVWAGLAEIVYGVGVDDFEDYNPNVIALRCQTVIDQAPDAIAIHHGLLREDCKRLHQEFPLED